MYFLSDLPVSGPGKGGKIGSSLTQHIMKELIKDTTRGLSFLFFSRGLYIFLSIFKIR
jgi:hypothetical protein